ncbi:MAG: hypothetical protein JWM84_2512 [Nocardioides sp.]|nr:hypothetical protein [Nocardioides sp.]
MRRTLGPLLLLTLLPTMLTGCGGDDGGATAQDAPSSSLPSPASSDEPPSDEPVVVALVSETAAGGASSDVLTAVAGPGLNAFLAQLESATLGDEVRAAIRAHTLPDGHSYGVAVVALGCDVPPDVHVTKEDGAWTVTPAKVPSPLPECFAPVTTVAVVDVPGEIAPAAADPATK